LEIKSFPSDCHYYQSSLGTWCLSLFQQSKQKCFADQKANQKLLDISHGKKVIDLKFYSFKDVKKLLKITL